jgi:hypothetical protein
MNTLKLNMYGPTILLRGPDGLKRQFREKMHECS